MIELISKIENYPRFVKLIGKMMEETRVKECLRIGTEWESSGTNPEIPVNDKINFKNPRLESTRRAYQNDMEIVYAFIFIATLYMVVVQPSYFVAKCCFMGFTILRFIHTIVYLGQVTF